MGTKPLKERKIMVHDMKAEAYDKRMKLNWNNKHQKGTAHADQDP